MPIPFAAFIPAIAAAGQNIVQGINNRNARRYNEPKQQVRRLREAGLPLAAGTNIQAGGGVATPVSNFGFDQFNDNIGKGTIRSIEKKKLDIAAQELAKITAEAQIAAGEAKNRLNPTGTFENTNQGRSIEQSLVQQQEANKTAETINKWLPIEKAQGVLKNDKEIAKISADTANSLAQNNILLSEGKIKSILAEWQGKMSQEEFTNIVRRNTGLKNANEISAIQGEILRNTKIAQIQSAQMAAVSAGQSVAANNMGLILSGLETEAAKSYYKVRASVDKKWHSGKVTDIISPTDLLYLKWMTPTQSNIRGSMPTLPDTKNYNTYQNTHYHDK